MKTDIELTYVSPFTFNLTHTTSGEQSVEAHDVEPELDVEISRDEDDGTAATDPKSAAASDGTRNDLAYFMDLASRYELLSAQEERELGLALWDGRLRLLRILRGALDLTPLRRRRPVTASTRRRLAKVEARARELVEASQPPANDGLRNTVAEMDRIRNELAERNLRLVVWVAKGFRGRGFDFIDLIQEGSLGLLRAIDRFDPLVGARFSTFATHWIQQGIRRALAEKARTIRIPVNRIPEVRQTLLARGRLAEQLGRPARPEELAKEVGLPKHKLEELLPAIAPIDSIDAPVASTDRSLGELLEDRHGPTPLEEAMEAETRRAIERVLHELPARQRRILEMRHGIGYPKECTLEEIGEALGLSRERIRQVEKVAARTVREWIEKNHPQLAEPN